MGHGSRLAGYPLVSSKSTSVACNARHLYPFIGNDTPRLPRHYGNVRNLKKL